MTEEGLTPGAAIVHFVRRSKLDIEILLTEAAKFAEVESIYDEPSLYGVTDGKAVGTYLEHKFIQSLLNNKETLTTSSH